MSTVDVRIVEMRFDNENFESNVKTSMSTLDKLKEKLNLDGATTGLSGVEKAAKSLDLSGVSEGVDQISNRFSNLGIVGMEVLKRITNTAIDFGTNAVKSVIDPIVEGGLKRAQNIEQAHFMLQGLIGDEEKVQEIMSQASESVNETAYSYDSAARAAAQFTASGVEAGPRLEGALKGVAGVAAMTGAQYEEISRIFTTTAGNGRVMGDTLLQLGTRGLNAAADMARFMNGVNEGTIQTTEAVKQQIADMTGGLKVAEADVREFISDKNTIVSFELFSETMANLYGAHAKKANETVNGVAANIKAALARIGADFFSPLIVQNGPLVQSLEKVRLKINEIRTMTGIIAKVTTPIAETLITAAGNFVETLDVSWIANIANVIGNLWSNINRPLNKDNILSSLQNFGEAFGNIWSNIKTVISSIGSAFKAVFPFEYFTEGLRNFSEGLKRLTENFKLSEGNAKSLQNAFKGIFSIVKTLVSLFTKVVSVLAHGLAPIIAVIGDAFLTFAGFIGNVVYKILDFIDKTGILKAAFEVIHSVIDAVITGFKAFGERIQSVINSIKNSDAFKQLADNLNRIWATIKNFASGVFNKIVSGLKSFSSWITKGASSVAGFIKEFGLFGTIAGGIQEAVGWLSTKFQNFGDAIGKVFDSIRNTDGFRRLSESVGKVWDSIKVFASSTFSTIVSNIRDFFGGDAFSFDFDPISTFVDLVDKAAGKVSDFIEAIQNGKNPIKDFIDGFKDFKFDFSFEGFKNLFKKIGRDIKSYVNIDSIKTAIKNVFTSIKTEIEKIDPEEIFDHFKEFLSKVVKGIGKLIEKIDFAGAFSSIGTAIKNGFKNTFGKINVEDVIKPFVDFFGRIGDALGKVDWGKILDFSKQILEFIVLMDLIRNTSKTLKSASKALDSLGGFLDTLSDRFSINKKDTKGDTILKIAGSIVLVAAAMYIIAQIDEDRLNKAITVIGGIFAAISLLLIFGKKIAGKDADFAAMGTAFGGIGLGMLGIAAAAKILGAMDVNELKQAAIVIGGLIGVFLLASRNAGDLNKAGGAFLGMALAIDLLIPALYLFGKMDWDTVKQGGLVIVALALALGTAARIATGGGGGTILALALAIDLLIPALLILSKMKWESILDGAMKLGLIMGELALAVRIAKSNGKSAGAILAMVVAIVAATAALVVLSLLPWQALIVSAASLGTVLLALGVAVKLSEKIKLGQVILMGVVLGEVVAALWILTKFTDADKLVSAAESLAVVLLAVSVSMAVLDKVSFNWRDIGKNAAMMGFALAEAVGALVLLDRFTNGEGLIVKATALGEVLIAVSAAMYILSNMKSSFSLGDIASTAVMMGVILLEATAALWALDKFVDGDGLIAKATALSEVLLAVSSAMVILSLIKSFDLGAVLEAAVGVDAVLVALGGLAVGVGALFEKFEGLEAKLDKGIEVVGKVVHGIGEWIGELIGGFGEGITDSLPAIGDNLSAFMTNLQPFIDGINGIDSARLESVVDSIGSMFGTITKSVLTDEILSFFGVGGTISTFGQNLSDFGTSFSNFASSINGIDDSVFTKTNNIILVVERFAGIDIKGEGGLSWIIGGNLATLGINLSVFASTFRTYASNIQDIEDSIYTKSNNIILVVERFASMNIRGNGALSWIIGGNLATLGINLSIFSSTFTHFADNIKSIEDSVYTKSNNIVLTVERFASMNIRGNGALSWIIGGNLATLGTNLSMFSVNFKDYADNAKTIDDSVFTKSNNIVLTVERFASIKIQGEGGLSWIIGGNLGTLGLHLSLFAKKFKTYADTAKTIDDSIFTKSNNLINLIENFASIKVKGEGGLSWIIGGNLATLGDHLSKFAKHFKAYATEVSGIQDNIATKSNNICNVIERFASLNIAGNGGAYGLLGEFGEQIKSFGASFKAYYDDIKGISVGIAQNAVDALEALIATAKNMASVNTSSIDSFGSSISTLGGKLKSWMADVSGIAYANVLAVCNSVRQILTLFEEMASTNYSGATGFTSALSSIANAGISGFTSALSGSGSQVTSAVASMMSTAASAIAGYYNTLYSAGYSAGQGAAAGIAAALANVSPTVSITSQNLGNEVSNGLSEGISQGTSSVVRATTGLSDAASTATRRADRIASPSKLYMEFGNYIAEGLAIGIEQGENRVVDASESVSEATIKSMKSALSRAMALLDDTGELSPTITPVLDLSQIQNGAALIGGLLGGQTIALTGTNSGLFNSNIAGQMEINEENSNRNVVEEIEKLRDDIGSLSDYVSKLRIVLDSGALVGGLIDPIDTQLGRRQVLAGRGV